jgi:hypothetical protein
MAADARVPWAAIGEAFGVPITVTLPNGDALEATGVWLSPANPDVPAAGGLRRRDPVRVMAMGRHEVPRIALGTVVFAPERLGEDPRWWRVDSVEAVDADEYRVVLSLEPNQ